VAALHSGPPRRKITNYGWSTRAAPHPNPGGDRRVVGSSGRRLDPFLTAVTAIASTSTLTLGTGIAVAFARNPMTLAVAANDLQQLSGGRFILGLGAREGQHLTGFSGVAPGRAVLH
jgi:alkanesulfonate monooxygenase SsuD/methylene tetrahydromethanopterin reductase-like flavin-dependent oxidoreductase (luciferase family)